MARYIVSDIFKGNYRTSQLYGNNPTYYKQFGFAGHEGVDWATPVGVEVLAPFDGKIIRDVDEAKSGAYGIHIVVWDPVQKCAVWYCHLSVNYVSRGQSVKRGAVLGLTGNSGNSTGPHLHVNFVETDASGNRLNTDNGYKGMLNILSKDLVEWKLGVQAAPAQPAPAPTPAPAPEPAPQVATVPLDKYQIDMGSKNVEINYLQGQIEELRKAYLERTSELEGSISVLTEALTQAKAERDDALARLKAPKSAPECPKTPDQTVELPDAESKVIAMIADWLAKFVWRK